MNGGARGLRGRSYAPMSALGAKRPNGTTEGFDIQARWMSALGAKRPNRQTEVFHIQAR
jgi:hypothetical protein